MCNLLNRCSNVIRNILKTLIIFLSINVYVNLLKVYNNTINKCSFWIDSVCKQIMRCLKFVKFKVVSIKQSSFMNRLKIFVFIICSNEKIEISFVFTDIDRIDSDDQLQLLRTLKQHSVRATFVTNKEIINHKIIDEITFNNMMTVTRNKNKIVCRNNFEQIDDVDQRLNIDQKSNVDHKSIIIQNLNQIDKTSFGYSEYFLIIDKMKQNGDNKFIIILKISPWTTDTVNILLTDSKTYKIISLNEMIHKLSLIK